MPDKRMNIVIGAKDAASSKLTDVRGSFHQIGLTAIEVNQALELARKGLEAFQDVYEFGKLGAETEKMEFAFERMSKAVGADSTDLLNKIRDLTDGTVSDFQIMQQAAKAATLGIPIDKVGEFAEIARAAAAAMGESTEFMFDSIVTGTARQSKLILDNLGIIVNQEEIYRKETERLGHTLSETEKRQAFINAVLKSGQKIISDIGDVSGLAINKYDQFEASMENLRRAGFKLSEKALTPIVGVLGSMAENLLLATTHQKSLTEAVRDGELAFNDMAEAVEYADRTVADYLRSEEHQAEVQQERIATSYEQLNADSLIAEGLNTLANSYGKVTAEATNTAETIDNVLIRTIEEETAVIEENIFEWEKYFETVQNIQKRIPENQQKLYLINTTLKKKETDIFTREEQEKLRIQQYAYNIMVNSSYILSYHMTEALLQGKAKAQAIFKAMANDFARYFISEVTKLLAAAVVKWVGMLLIFDKRENDLMAMQMGRDYAMYFQQGVSEEMNTRRLAQTMSSNMTPQMPIMAGAPSTPAPAGRTVVIHIRGNVIGEEEWLRKSLIPALEDKIKTKEADFTGY